jgi:ISXO2-like transposase domain
MYRKNKFILHCNSKKCPVKVKKNFTKGTVFYKKNIKTVLKVIRLWCSKVFVVAISSLLGIHRNCVSNIIKKLKNKLETGFYESFSKIGGSGIIVEVNESKFGKIKYHKGHRVDGVWIFGLVERTERRRILLIEVDNRKRETLESVLHKYVHQESIIHSDCWKAYDRLSKFFSEHKTVNHSKSFLNEEND